MVKHEPSIRILYIGGNMLSRGWREAAQKAGRLPDHVLKTKVQQTKMRNDLLNEEIAENLERATRELTWFIASCGADAKSLLQATKQHIRIGGYHHGGFGKYVNFEGDGLRLYVDGAACDSTIEEAAYYFVAFGPWYSAGVAAWLEYQLDLIVVDVQLG